MYNFIIFLRYVKRDKVRFDLADVDDDSILNFEEFTAFLHPEEFEHMAGNVCYVYLLFWLNASNLFNLVRYVCQGMQEENCEKIVRIVKTSINTTMKSHVNPQFSLIYLS